MRSLACAPLQRSTDAPRSREALRCQRAKAKVGSAPEGTRDNSGRYELSSGVAGVSAGYTAHRMDMQPNDMNSNLGRQRPSPEDPGNASKELKRSQDPRTLEWSQDLKRRSPDLERSLRPTW